MVFITPISDSRSCLWEPENYNETDIPLLSMNSLIYYNKSRQDSLFREVCDYLWIKKKKTIFGTYKHAPCILPAMSQF